MFRAKLAFLNRPGDWLLVASTGCTTKPRSTLSSSSLGVTVHERIAFDHTTAETGGKLELTYANHTFTDENVGTGLEMKFDGRLYATVVFPTTPEEALRYLKTDGSPLSGREVEDLTALLNRVVSTEFLWVELAWP